MGKYVDIPTIMQVIGAVYNNPDLLDQTEKYNFCEEDFTEDFHKTVFGSIYNLHALGSKAISINTIEDYLVNYPKQYSVYKVNRGPEYLQKLSENTQIAAFDYYYKRMKKMTLLRMYNNIGVDLTWLYDPDNILDIKKKESQEAWIDATPIEDIADLIDKRIDEIRIKYVDNYDSDFSQAAEGIDELLEQLAKHPDIGYPLYGPIINTITRGARLKKFYLRSAATNTGKTRTMIADSCWIGCDKIYDKRQGEWINCGAKEPVLYITTEQERSEVQTMMLAFIANVDETHINMSQYEDGEEERVWEARDILKQSDIWVKKLSDFSIQDIENAIKVAVNDHKVKYIFHDYIHTSLKILTEISSKTSVKGLREDNILFMLSTRLKDICNKYGIFILSSTQLNGSYVDADVYDQNLLRGAKAIADKIDIGEIMLPVIESDLAALEKVLTEGGFEAPTIKISIYKNRGNRWKNILLWCRADLGTCRIEPMFVTNYRFELIKIDDLRITVAADNEISFESEHA